MNSKIKEYFQCPYCPRGRGVLALDLGKVQAGLPDPPPQPIIKAEPVPTGDEWADRIAWLDHKIATFNGVSYDCDLGEPGGIFVFDPNAAATGPCKHVVLLSPDVYAAHVAPLASEPVGWSYEDNWYHPWLAKHDAGGRVKNVLWNLVMCPSNREPGYGNPTQPHKAGRVCRSWLSKRSLWKVDVELTFAVAMEPGKFLNELRTFAEKYQQGECPV